MQRKSTRAGRIVVTLIAILALVAVGAAAWFAIELYQPFAGAGGQKVRVRVPNGLTAREIEVLQLLARGLSNKEIAERLVISRKTAGHHIEHIYAKTGTANRALASLFAANHGLIQGPAADVIPGAADSRSTGPASR